MRYIKLIFKVILILLIPIVMQVVVTFGLAIQTAVKLVQSGTSQELIEATLQNMIAGKLTLIVGLASILTLLIFFVASAAKGKSFTNDYAIKKISLKHIGLSIAVTLTGYMLSLGINGTFDMAAKDPKGAEAVAGLVMNMNFPITLFIIGLVVPFVEEIVFRGAIMRNLKRHMPIAAVLVIQAALFGLYHMNLVQGFMAFFLGLNIGLAVYFSGSLWAGILIHALNNSISVILSRALPEDFDISKIGFILLLGLGLGLSAVIQSLFYKSKVEQPQITEQEMIEAV